MARNPADRHDIWGPAPPRTPPIRHDPGYAVGQATVKGAVDHLHWEHPNHVQGEDLQGTATRAIHHPVTSSTYKGSTSTSS